MLLLGGWLTATLCDALRPCIYIHIAPPPPLPPRQQIDPDSPPFIANPTNGLLRFNASHQGGNCSAQAARLNALVQDCGFSQGATVTVTCEPSYDKAVWNGPALLFGASEDECKQLLAPLKTAMLQASQFTEAALVEGDLASLECSDLGARPGWLGDVCPEKANKGTFVAVASALSLFESGGMAGCVKTSTTTTTTATTTTATTTTNTTTTTTMTTTTTTATTTTNTTTTTTTTTATSTTNTTTTPTTTTTTNTTLAPTTTVEDNFGPDQPANVTTTTPLLAEAWRLFLTLTAESANITSLNTSERAELRGRIREYVANASALLEDADIVSVAVRLAAGAGAGARRARARVRRATTIEADVLLDPSLNATTAAAAAEQVKDAAAAAGSPKLTLRGATLTVTGVVAQRVSGADPSTTPTPGNATNTTNTTTTAVATTPTPDDSGGGGTDFPSETWHFFAIAGGGLCILISACIAVERCSTVSDDSPGNATHAGKPSNRPPATNPLMFTTTEMNAW